MGNLKKELEVLAGEFDLPSITEWKQGQFIDQRRYSHMSDEWRREQRQLKDTTLLEGEK